MGLTWLKLPPTAHHVCFGDVDGWTTPQCEWVPVSEGTTTEVVGTFTQRGSLRINTDPAQDATVTVDGVPRDNWGVWTALEPAPYEVCFRAPGTSESCVSPQVEAGTLTTVAGSPN